MASKESARTGQETKSDIVLFKNVVAGDYSVLHILDDGQIEFTAWNRLHRITSHKLGFISRPEVIKVSQLIAEKEFYQLATNYDIYPLPPDDTKIYEDIYFITKARSDKQEKVVHAHEQAMPAQLKEIVDTLLDILTQVPELPKEGNFIMVGSPEVLQYKRFRPSNFVLHLSEQDLNQYPLLMEALNNPYAPISIRDIDDRKLREILNEKQNNIEIILDDERSSVIFLKSGNQ